MSNDSIIVAVIDDGVTSHEDLPENRLLPGIDFANNDNDPAPGEFTAHGMACAGIIAASHTTDSVAGLSSASGMISLNPKVFIRPIKIFNDNGTSSGMKPSGLAAAITYAWSSGAEILSNSWAYYRGCPQTGGLFDVLNEAIEEATVLGRGGLGSVVTFASGNGYPAQPTVLYPGCLPAALSVGAIQLSDLLWNYTSRGVELDIVAPSGNGSGFGNVWSLDQMNNSGWNPSLMSDCPPSSNDPNYDCRFGGTSGAAPIVAGVASLVLAKNPTLTSQDVYDILRNSAVTHLDWGTITPPNDEYGYGRVDAFRAVLSISRGDINNDGQSFSDLSDLIYLVNYLMLGGPDPFPSVLLADVNCDGQVDLSDLNYLVDHQIFGGPPPVNPCFKFGD